jgi:DNA-binding Lrp family transcriptional regulator
MSDPLSILFGSTARVKLLRFFLFNPSKEFLFDDISRRAKLVRRTARTEISALEKAGVIKQKTIYIEVEGKSKKMKAIGYALNKDFQELQALQTFLFETAPIDGKNLLKHLRQAGILDFVGVSGVFVRDFEQRLDVMLSMKKFSQLKVEKAIRSLESEVGIEIRFAAMSSEDLMYRVGMYDKLTRDFFDYNHQVLIDKIGVKDEVTSSNYRM